MERSVIGTRRSSCVCKLEGRFVVEHEAVMKTRDKKKRKERAENNQQSRDRGRSDAVTRLFLSVVEGSLQCTCTVYRNISARKPYRQRSRREQYIVGQTACVPKNYVNGWMRAAAN